VVIYSLYYYKVNSKVVPLIGVGQATNNGVETMATKTKTATVFKHKSKGKKSDGLHAYATAYVIITVIMSMMLNAWANMQHAAEGQQLAAGAMGAVIPVLVLLLSKVAGICYKRRASSNLAKISGAIGVAVLGLSIFHCYQSIAALTGSGMLLSMLLALGIDAGMVVCEVVTVMERK
jgi:hypothetical protein